MSAVLQLAQKQLEENGFTLLPNQLSPAQISAFSSEIDQYIQAAQLQQPTQEVFAIRNLVNTIPGLIPQLHAAGIPELAHHFLGDAGVIIRSIYFNKPAAANWVVPWHQDLTVTVSDRESQYDGLTKWALKGNQLTAKAPASLLAQVLTIRIHLTACDETNGALKVIPGSHALGELQGESLKEQLEKLSTICCSDEGGIMLMRPLLLHASLRSTGNERRVIHLELISHQLLDAVNWSEKLTLADSSNFNTSLLSE